MQVANSLNNIIRILFNPKIESFRLFDFLIVKCEDDRYLAQIIEIYDDKFDSSQNVAKLKLFYKIAENNEVMPYDNFTPNKECEIIKIMQNEVEDFINQDKKTFIFGTNVKSSSSLNLQYDFFNKNALILADKIENSCIITNNLAKNLSKEHPVVVIDSTGIMDFENAKVIKAAKNFKLPLNYTTIDFIFDKCLADGSLEFQTVCGDIINEIKKFSKKQEDNFIPFNTFVRVLLEQYKVTPYIELKLLITRLKKFQMDEVFARSKKDAELLNKTVSKSDVTVVDLSGVDVSWQKAFLEYIVEEIDKEVYLLVRFNDENCDVDLINTIYTQKENINLVPNVSYNYKKLPSIIQYCKNYILLPSLYQRMDFLDANFALSNLISDGCIIFGENTDNFLYYAKDYNIIAQEKRKNYRKIALSMAAKETESENDEPKEEVKTTVSPDSQKLIDELSKFEQEQLKSLKETFEPIEEHVATLENKLDDFDESQNIKSDETPSLEQSYQDDKDVFEDKIENPKPTQTFEADEDLIFKHQEEQKPQPIEQTVNENSPSQTVEDTNINENQTEPSQTPELETESVKQPSEENTEEITDEKVGENPQEKEQENIEASIDKIESSEEQISINEEKLIIDEDIEINETEELVSNEITEDNSKIDIEQKEEQKEDIPAAAIKEEANDLIEKDEIIKPLSVENIISDDKAKEENKEETKEPAKEEAKAENKEEAKEENKNIAENQPKPEINRPLGVINDEPEVKKETETADIQKPLEIEPAPEVELSDEELDFFELAKEGSAIEKMEEESRNYALANEAEKEDKKADTQENNQANTKTAREDDVNLNDIANLSIDKTFEHIINSKGEKKPDEITLDKDTVITSEKLEEINKQGENTNLPIFKEKLPEKSQTYSIGDTVYHKNYGKGIIVKLVQYEDRQLLQIAFEKAGKKLLDPKVADIKTE